MMIRTGRLERVLEHALRAPSVHNTQPWRWQLRGDVIELFADVDHRPTGNDHGRRDLLISCGAALHHFLVALAHDGHDAYVTYLSDLGDDTPLATITVTDAPPDPATARLFGAIERRHTERRRMSYRPIPTPLRDALVTSAQRFGARLVPTPQVREAFTVAFTEAAERERWIPSHTTELRIWSHQGVRGRVLADQRPPEDAAEFFVLTTAEDQARDRLRVGEALSSVLLTATNAGLATMPLSLDPDGEVLRLDDVTFGHPQIVVRTGWPLAAPRTRR